MSRTELVQDLQTRLDALVDPASRAWWERYLEGSAPFRGVRTDNIQAALRAWHERPEVAGLGAAEALELAHDLIRQPLIEDKLAGMLYLRDIVLSRGDVDWRAVLPSWTGLFADGALANRNACDWFAQRVLGPTARAAGRPCARAIAAWSGADNVWQQRASVVSFVDVARGGDENFRGFVGLMLALCGRVVRNPEPEAQSAVAWLLRELAVAEPAKVERFVFRNFSLMSPEAVRDATKKKPAARKGSAGG